VFASDETIEGGPGEDTVDYGGRVPGVAVDTDGVPDDGAIDPITIGGQTVAEHDNVQPDVEHVIAGAGNDRLMAAWMSGGGGDDVLMDRAGAQRFSGGAGDDTATYADRNQAITADPDGIVGDDGAAGEGDTIDTDVENLHGGAGEDQLRAGGSGALLVGAAGDDLLQGGPGDDTLDGGQGDDLMVGGPGKDADYSERQAAVTVSSDDRADDGEADEYDDVSSDVEDLIGGSDDDLLVGNAGDGLLDGGPGDDDLDGGAGADQLVGGPGADAVDYSQRAAAVSVSFNGIADDGSAEDNGPGGRDLVSADTEIAIGGSGPDVLSAARSPSCSSASAAPTASAATAARTPCPTLTAAPA
jgi:Ca2+-binding RTX toxin-like protein